MNRSTVNWMQIISNTCVITVNENGFNSLIKIRVSEAGKKLVSAIYFVRDHKKDTKKGWK